MILKRLGIGKKSEYFLEAEPASSSEAKEAKEAKPEPKQEPAKATHQETPAQAAQPIDLKAVEAALAVEGTTNGATPAPATTATAKQKKVKKTKSSSDAAPEAAAPAKTAPAVPTPEPTTANFATDYLLPSNTPRRRPGPSLDPYKDMAKQVSPRK